ncbi:hypothetical protein [Nocardiopsis synnemataformans]
MVRDGVEPRLIAEALESPLDPCLTTDEETQQEFSTDPFAEFSER